MVSPAHINIRSSPRYRKILQRAGIESRAKVGKERDTISYMLNKREEKETRVMMGMRVCVYAGIAVL